MFGFSITKLLFTIAAVVGVWYVFKWAGRMQVRQQEGARERIRTEKAQGDADAARRQRADAAEDMIKCPTCGEYLAASATRNCGKADCPYPG